MKIYTTEGGTRYVVSGDGDRTFELFHEDICFRKGVLFSLGGVPLEILASARELVRSGDLGFVDLVEKYEPEEGMYLGLTGVFKLSLRIRDFLPVERGFVSPEPIVRIE